MADLDKKESALDHDTNLYNKKIKPIPKPQPNISVDTDEILIKNILQSLEDGLTGQSSQLDISSISKFTQISQKRDSMYKMLDTMAQDSKVSSILETYAEYATEYNDQGQIVWCEANDPNIAKYVGFLLDTMNVDKNIYNWVYSLCLYGDVYIELFRQSELNKIDKFFDNEEEIDRKRKLDEDLKLNLYKSNDKYSHYVERVSNPAELFELTKFGKTVGYIKAAIPSALNIQQDLTQNIYNYKFKKGDIDIYPADKFVHAMLENNNSRVPEEVTLFMGENSEINSTYTVKRGQSLLYDKFKVWRVLSLLENSLVLNRVTKSSIVRLINVEVGDMPKEMVGKHLLGIKQLMEQKATFKTDETMDEYTNPGPIENNIYIPVHGDKGTVTSTQIGGDVNVGQLPDIDYFVNSFYGAMRVPKQYYGFTEDGAGFNGGQSLAIISSGFAKMVKKIQNTMVQALTDAINLMLIDKGMNNYVNKFTIHMLPPTTQEEIDRRDNLSSKVGITSDLMNLISDVEDPKIKMKILKSLLSNIITDTEVIGLIQEQIDNMEEGVSEEVSTQEEEEGIPPSESTTSETSFNEPLNLDSELGLETETPELGEEEGEALPTPEELNAGDFTEFPLETGEE